jgi:hypothetical protein
MKSKFLALCLALSAMSAAHAQFGGLGALTGGTKSSGADVGPMIEEFNKDSLLMNQSVSSALLQIVAALGDKTDVAKVKAISENLAKTTDVKEQGSISGAYINDGAVKAQELLNSTEAKAKMEKLAPAMQKKVADSIFQVGIAALRIPGLMDKGKKIIDGIGTNPMNVSKIGPIKDGLSMFADAAPKLPAIVSTGFKLMRDVNINPGTPSKDSTFKKPETLSLPEE